MVVLLNNEHNFAPLFNCATLALAPWRPSWNGIGHCLFECVFERQTDVFFFPRAAFSQHSTPAKTHPDFPVKVYKQTKQSQKSQKRKYSHEHSTESKVTINGSKAER